jgi:Fe-S-cluster-containing dehydrogenase component/CRP-like cAMP-binding protein
MTDQGNGPVDDQFAPDITEADLDRVLLLPLFLSLDAARFPAHASLRNIIRRHARIERYERGRIILRERDYGSSAFLVIAGAVGVLPRGAVASPGSTAPRGRRTYYSALSQLWRNADVAEARDPARYRIPIGVELRDLGGDQRLFVRHPDTLTREHKMAQLGPSEMFGEIAALSRTPRTASVVALGDCELLELRWQGLREIRRHDDGFRNSIDALYRDRSLKNHLSESPLFKDLDEDVLSRIAEATRFETYGEFEWVNSFNREIRGVDPSVAVEREPAIALQGDYVDGLIMVRSGFARVSERLGHGHRTVRVAAQNDVFGLQEIVEHHRADRPLALRHSLRAIGYVDILRVPTSLVHEHVLPRLVLEPPPRAAKSGHALATVDPAPASVIDQSLMDFLVDERFINGTAAMMINTDRCTGCDDCVRACAASHDNNPRFVRDGPQHGKFLVASACMHCRDPVCLIGCPTGAIHRMVEDGRVIIDDATCVGCGTCAQSCPYNNIRLVEIRDHSGAFILDQTTGAPVVKATKCDLCLDQPGGPACQRACPHDALVRIDIGDHAGLAGWIDR